jgi:uncharacterized protein
MSQENNVIHEQKNIQKRRRMHIGISFTVVLIALAIIFMSKKTPQDTSPASITPSFKKQGELIIQRSGDQSMITIDIEIADDEAKREVGLMGRSVMEERQGMLFVFNEEQYASFWMRNTILSLDMIFVNKQRQIITIHKNTKPFSEDSYPAAGLTLYVLEVNAGFTDKYGIKEGDMISWKRN